MITLIPFNEFIWAGTNRIQNKCILICFHNCLRNNCCKWNCKVAKCWCVRCSCLNRYGMVIIHCNFFNKVNNVRNSCRITCTVKGEFNIFCCQIASIMELNALTNFKYISLVIRLFPAFSNLRNNFVGLWINCNQRIKDLCINLNSRCFLTLMRVKGGNVRALCPSQSGLITVSSSTVGSVVSLFAAASCQ